MTQHEDDQLGAWLEAERSERFDEAEARFSTLFAGQVPVLEPPPGLAHRVLAASLSGRRVAPWTWRPVRALGAASLVLMAGTLAGLLALDVFAVVAAVATTASALVADARTLVSACTAAGVTAWTLSLSVGRAVLVASTSGIMPFVLAANLLLALASSYGLTRVLAPREECPQ